MGSRTLGLVEFALGRRLFGTDAACHNLRAEIVFAAQRCAGKAAKHADLSDVRQRVRDRTLKKLFGRKQYGRVGSQISVECLEGGEKPLHPLFPGKGRGIVPLVLSLR